MRKDFGVEVLIYHRRQIAKTDFDKLVVQIQHFQFMQENLIKVYNTVHDYRKFCDAINQLVLEASPSQ